MASSLGEGYNQGLQSGLNQAKLLEFNLDQLGDQALGRTFQSLGQAPQGMPGPVPGMGQPPGPGGVPMPPGAGAPPQQQAQAPPPQQQAPPSGPMGERWPAVPMGAGSQLLGRALANPPQGTVMNPGQPRQAMAQAQTPPPEMPTIPPRQPPQGPPQGGGNMPQPQGQFDLNTAASAIAKANPGIRPEVLVHALARAMPYLNAQAQNEVKQAMQQMKEYGLTQRDEALKQGQDRVIQAEERIAQQGQEFQQKQGLAERKTELAEKKEAAKALDPAVAKFMASQLLSGQPPSSVLGGMARNAQAIQQVRSEFAKMAMEQGVSPQEIGRRMQEFGGQQTAYKALGTAEARMANAAMSADVLIPVLEEASKKVNRSEFPDLNKIILAAEQKTGSPEVVAFGNAVQSVANTYAGVMSRGYQPSEASRKTAAMNLLNQYWSQGQLDAGIAIIKKEIAAEMSAPGKVRDYWAKRNAPQDDKGTETTSPKPMTDSVRSQAQAAMKRGWTLQQITDKLKQEGYDTSTIKAPTNQPDL